MRSGSGILQKGRPRGAGPGTGEGPGRGLLAESQNDPNGEPREHREAEKRGCEAESQIRENSRDVRDKATRAIRRRKEVDRRGIRMRRVVRSRGDRRASPRSD